MRTLAVLVARPGYLFTEYVAGRRRAWLRPLQLFMLCNAVFFVVQPYSGFNIMSTPLQVHMEGLPHSEIASRMAAEAVRSRNATWADYRLAFDTASSQLSRTLVILMVPLFALAVRGIAARTSAAHKPVVFSLHFYAFMLLVLPVALQFFLALAWGGRALGLGAGPVWALVEGIVLQLYRFVLFLITFASV